MPIAIALMANAVVYYSYLAVAGNAFYYIHRATTVYYNDSKGHRSELISTRYYLTNHKKSKSSY